MTTTERNAMAQSLRGPVDLRNQDSGAGIWKQFIAERVGARDPNYCRVCTPKGLGYCQCEIASNE